MEYETGCSNFLEIKFLAISDVMLFIVHSDVMHIAGKMWLWMKVLCIVTFEFDIPWN